MYVRTASGECYEAEPDAAIEQFLSADGYRITFTLGTYEFILRRDPDTPVELSEFLPERVARDCSVTVRDCKLRLVS